MAPLPPLPPGFTLDDPTVVPPPPPGFTLDPAARRPMPPIPPPPAGFTIDSQPSPALPSPALAPVAPAPLALEPTFAPTIEAGGGISVPEQRASPTLQIGADTWRGLRNVRGLGKDLLGLGEYAVGAEDAARQKFAEAQAYNAETEAKLPRIVKTYKDVPGTTAGETAANALRYLGENVFEQLPMTAPALLGGGIGGMLAKKAATTAAEKAAAGLIGNAAKVAARKAAEKVIGRAAAAGAFIPATAMNTGESAGQIFAESGEIRPGVSVVAGIVKGALDVLPEANLIKKIMSPEIYRKMTGGLVKGLVGRMGETAAQQWLLEGGTEVIQNNVDRWATHYVDPSSPIYGDEALQEDIDTALGIGASSAVMGIVGEGAGTYRMGKARSERLAKLQEVRRVQGQIRTFLREEAAKTASSAPTLAPSAAVAPPPTPAAPLTLPTLAKTPEAPAPTPALTLPSLQGVGLSEKATEAPATPEERLAASIKATAEAMAKASEALKAATTAVEGQKQAAKAPEAAAIQPQGPATTPPTAATAGGKAAMETEATRAGLTGEEARMQRDNRADDDLTSSEYSAKQRGIRKVARQNRHDKETAALQAVGVSLDESITRPSDGSRNFVTGWTKAKDGSIQVRIENHTESSVRQKLVTVRPGDTITSSMDDAIPGTTRYTGEASADERQVAGERGVGRTGTGERGPEATAQAPDTGVAEVQPAPAVQPAVGAVEQGGVPGRQEKGKGVGETRKAGVFKGWLAELTDAQRDSVLSEMRLLREKADSSHEEYRRLAPPGGTIGVGAADFDAFIRGESRAEFLRNLGQGDDPQTAAEKTKTYVREAVVKHNSKRKDYNWKRDEGMEDRTIASALRGVLNAAKPPPVSALPPLTPTSAPAPKPTTREPWEMTRAEYGVAERPPLRIKVNGKMRDNSAYDQWRMDSVAHRESVEDAVRSGKPVSASVLADYPNLRTQPSTATPDASASAPARTEAPPVLQPPAREMARAGVAPSTESKEKTPELMTPAEFRRSVSSEKWSPATIHTRHDMAVLAALEAKRPVLATLVDGSQMGPPSRRIQLPPGYVRKRDRYVFQTPSTIPAPAAPATSSVLARQASAELDFNPNAGPFLVEWGTRATGNKTQTFDDMSEAIAFANLKERKADFVSIFDNNGVERPAQEPPSSKDAALAAASRTRPRERIVFEKPFVGPSGNSLIAYEWMWMPYEYVDNRGEDRTKRVSDWDAAEVNDETGRQIVHQFVVKREDGGTQTVSAETALQLLGYETKAASGGLPSLVSAVKTLAKLRMERDSIQRQHDEAKRISDAVEKMPLPPVEEGVREHRVEVGRMKGTSERTRVLRMGDAEVWLSHGQSTRDSERIETLKWAWREKRMKELGMQTDWRLLRDRLKDRDRRIAKQEAKIKQINETSEAAPRSSAVAPSSPTVPESTPRPPESTGATKPAPTTAAKQAVKVEPTPDGKTVSVPSADRPGLPMKEQKKFLLAEIDKAIEGTTFAQTADIPNARLDPIIAEIGQALAYGEGETTAATDAKRSDAVKKLDTLMDEYSVQRTSNDYSTLDELRSALEVQRLSEHPRVTIEVPNDGTFAIINSKEALTRFRELAKKFPVSPLKSSDGIRTSTAPSSVVKVAEKRPVSQADMKDAVSVAASTDETREILMQVHVDGKQKAMVATDGRRLAVVLKAPFATTKHKVKEFKSEKDKSTGKITRYATGKMIEGDYPNFMQVVPGGREGQLPDITDKKTASIDTGVLASKLNQALAATKAITQGKNRDVGDPIPSVAVYLMPDGDVEVATTHADVGGYESGEVARGKLVGTFSIEFLKDGLTFMRKMGNSTATLAWQDDETPLLILGKAEFYVQMPIRTGGGKGARLRELKDLPKTNAIPHASAGPTAAPEITAPGVTPAQFDAALAEETKAVPFAAEGVWRGNFDDAEEMVKAAVESGDGQAAVAEMERADAETRSGSAKAFIPPKKTIKAYKLFRTLRGQPGKLFPLFIGKDKPTPVGTWIPAEFIPTQGFATRPGWHAGIAPFAPHLMRKDGTMQPGRVWAEVEIPADEDWQSMADESPTRDIRGEVPVGGHYRFKTSKMQGGAWIIGGAIKVNRVLSDKEVAELQPRFYRSRNGQVRAVTIGNRSFFFLDRYDDASQLRQDIREEAGHRLVNELGGNAWSGPGGIGYMTYRGKWKAIADEIRRNYRDREGNPLRNGSPDFAHELVAKAFRDGQHDVALWRRFLDAVVASVKRFLRKRGVPLKVSDAELRNFINTALAAKVEAMGRNGETLTPTDAMGEQARVDASAGQPQFARSASSATHPHPADATADDDARLLPIARTALDAIRIFRGKGGSKLKADISRLAQLLGVREHYSKVVAALRRVYQHAKGERETTLKKQHAIFEHDPQRDWSLTTPIEALRSVARPAFDAVNAHVIARDQNAVGYRVVELPDGKWDLQRPVETLRGDYDTQHAAELTIPRDAETNELSENYYVLRNAESGRFEVYQVGHETTGETYDTEDAAWLGNKVDYDPATSEWITHNPDGSEAGRHATFSEAWLANNGAIAAEARDLRDELARHPDAKVQANATQAAGALAAFRKIAHNDYAALYRSLDQLVSEDNAKGPGNERQITLTTTAGKRQTVSVRQAMKEMGDRRGFWMPRSRTPGVWQVYAKREGEHPIYKKFDTRAVASLYAAQQKSKGYTVGGWEAEATRPGEDPQRVSVGTIEEARQWADSMRAKGYTVGEPYAAEISRVSSLHEDVWDAMTKMLNADRILNDSLARVGKNADFTERLQDFGFTPEWTPAPRQGQLASLWLFGVGDKPAITAVLTELGGTLEKAPDGSRKGWRFTYDSAATNSERDLAQNIIAGLHTTGAYGHGVLGFAKLIEQDLANILRSRGARSHMIPRKTATGINVPIGYDDDVLTAITNASNGIAASLGKYETLQNMQKAITGRDMESWQEWKSAPEQQAREQATGEKPQYKDYLAAMRERGLEPAQNKQPLAYADAMRLVEQIAKNDDQLDRMFRRMSGLTTVWFLAGRIPSGIINLTSGVTINAATLSAKLGVSLTEAEARTLAAYGDWFRYFARYMGGSKADAMATLDDDTKSVLTEIMANGWDEERMIHDSLQAGLTRGQRGWNKVMHASMWLFGRTEQANRVASILAAYRIQKAQAEKAGTTFDRKAALDRAKELSDASNAEYGEANLPHLMTGRGFGPAVGRLMYKFMNFSHNYAVQFGNVGGLTTKQGWWMMLAPAILAGAAGSPLLAGLEGILKNLLPPDEDPEESFYAFLQSVGGDFAENLGRTGIIGAPLGIDISGSMSIFPHVPSNYLELLGATGAVANQIYEGAQAVARGDVRKGMENLTPMVLSRPLRAIREHTEGVTTRQDKPVYYKGERVVSDTMDMWRRALGFNPARVSKLSKLMRDERQRTGRFSETRQDIYRRFNAFYLQPSASRDTTELMDILDDIKAYNGMAERVGEAFITSESLKRALVPAQYAKAAKPRKPSDIATIEDLRAVTPKPVQQAGMPASQRRASSSLSLPTLRPLPALPRLNMPRIAAPRLSLPTLRPDESFAE